MNDDVAAFEDLVGAIIAHDPDLRTDDRDRILAALHHNHLPKLDEAGLINYDVQSETVEYYGDPTVECLLTSLQD